MCPTSPTASTPPPLPPPLPGPPPSSATKVNLSSSSPDPVKELSKQDDQAARGEGKHAEKVSYGVDHAAGPARGTRSAEDRTASNRLSYRDALLKSRTFKPRFPKDLSHQRQGGVMEYGIRNGEGKCRASMAPQFGTGLGVDIHSVRRKCIICSRSGHKACHSLAPVLLPRRRGRKQGAASGRRWRGGRSSTT
jgi:hypothetical protein